MKIIRKTGVGIARAGANLYANTVNKVTLSGRASTAARTTNRFAIGTSIDQVESALDQIARAATAGNYHLTLKLPYNKLNVVANRLKQKKYLVFVITPKSGRAQDKFLDVFWPGKRAVTKTYGKGATADYYVENQIIAVLPTDYKTIELLGWQQGAWDLTEWTSDPSLRQNLITYLVNDLNTRS